MIAIKIYENGSIETEDVVKEDNIGWMENKSIGGYDKIICGLQNSSCKVILLDGNNKKYHLQRRVNRMTKDIDSEIKQLQKKKKKLLELLDLDI